MKKRAVKTGAALFGVLILFLIGRLGYKMHQLSELEKMDSGDMIKYDTRNDKDTKISIAVVKDDVVDYKVYGCDGIEEKDTSYEYEIGSISKTFLSLMLSKAIDEGKINLSDSISKYLELDEGRYYPTIERLITHTSGYKAYYFESEMIPNKFTQSNDYYGISKKKILNKVKEVKLEDKDYKFVYSNFGIAVLGLVLEQVYDKDFTTLMNDFIENDLHLEHTSTATGTGNLEKYWNWKKNDGYIPAGSIISNIEDMTDYLKIYLNQEEDYITKTYTPIKDADVHNYMYDKLDINMDKAAMAWMVDTKNDFVWHNGATSNFNSYIAFNKEKNTGIVILSNMSPKKKIPMTVLGSQMMKELCKE